MQDKNTVVLGEFDSPQAMDASVRQAKLLAQSLGREITFSTRTTVIALVGPVAKGETKGVASDFSGPLDCKVHSRHFPSLQAKKTHVTLSHKKTRRKK